jgi:predicted nucleotidyltransferase
MNKSTILSEFKRVKPELANKYGLSSFALFGSYSRDEQTVESDSDLLVDFEKTDVHNFFNCAFALEDMLKDKKVHIVTRDGIKPKYFEVIKQDLLYA